MNVLDAIRRLRAHRLAVAGAPEPVMDARQAAYVAEVTATHTGNYPHCDELVLHAPSSCGYCGMPKYREMAKLRILHQVAFTNGDAPGLSPCPSTVRRTADTRDLWAGNRPRS